MITKRSSKNMPSKMVKEDPSLRPVQVYVPPQLWRQVRAIASLRGMQVRELVALALSDLVKNNNNKAA